MYETLKLYAKDGAYYQCGNVTNVRLSNDELRWINSRGEKDGMARAFLDKYVHEVELSK